MKNILYFNKDKNITKLKKPFIFFTTLAILSIVTIWNMFFDPQKQFKFDHKWLPNTPFIFFISLAVLFGITMWMIIINPRQRYKLNLFIKNTSTKLNLGLILIFIIYSFTFFKPNSFMVKATKAGIYAIIIAFCAFLEIPLIPFWFTHLIFYFSQDTVMK